MKSQYQFRSLLQLIPKNKFDMPIQDILALDHFYITVSQDEFGPLKDLCGIFKRCHHSIVKSDNDTWEGIYLQSRSGCYFEILRDRRLGGMGVCLSSAFPFYVDSKNIIQERSDLQWQSGTRHFEDGTKWYDWYSTDNYLDLQNTLFNAWVMKYDPTHRSMSRKIHPPFVDRFVKLKMKAGKNLYEAIKRNSQWFSGEQRFTENEITILIPEKDGYVFEIKIEMFQENSNFIFDSLELKLIPEVSISSAKLGDFDLQVDSSLVKLKRNGF